jgi:hypothetical protein
MSTGTGTGSGGEGKGAPPPGADGHHAGGGPGPDQRLAATEENVYALEKRVKELEEALAAARRSAANAEHRAEVYRVLVESGAAHVEAAAQAINERIDDVAQPDIADEVRALKRRKPGLFKRTATVSSMGGRDADPPPSPIDSAARDARSGGRAALLRYMRARRA